MKLNGDDLVGLYATVFRTNLSISNLTVVNLSFLFNDLASYFKFFFIST